MTYGTEKPEVRPFWILMEKPTGTPADPKTTPNVEISVASHHAHGSFRDPIFLKKLFASGPHQNSETVRQLRTIIDQRRKQPESAVGWWKWAITMIGGVSQIVVYIF